jgi:hypothetical protein
MCSLWHIAALQSYIGFATVLYMVVCVYEEKKSFRLFLYAHPYRVPSAGSVQRSTASCRLLGLYRTARSGEMVRKRSLDLSFIFFSLRFFF